MVNESKTQRRKIKKTLTLHWNKKKKKEIEIQRHDDEFLEYLGKKKQKSSDLEDVTFQSRLDSRTGQKLFVNRRSPRASP